MKLRILHVEPQSIWQVTERAGIRSIFKSSVANHLLPVDFTAPQSVQHCRVSRHCPTNCRACLRYLWISLNLISFAAYRRGESDFLTGSWYKFPHMQDTAACLSCAFRHNIYMR